VTAVIVGGGVAGLVAARELSKAGLPVLLVEGSSRLGGQIWTEQANGFIVEHGAEGFSPARPETRALLEEVGLTGRMVSQGATGALALRRGKLHPLKPGEAARLAGIQASAAELGQGTVSLRGGTGELIEALAQSLPAGCLKLEVEVRAIRPGKRGWEVLTSAGQPISAGAVILAIPPACAAEVLAQVSPAAARKLRSLPAVSSVSVSLAYPRQAVGHPLDGMGFVRPGPPERAGLRACSFVSSQFSSRVPPGYVLLRAFFRPGPRLALSASDTRWIARASQSLSPVLGIRGEPARAWVARWRTALPRYAEDHEARLGEIETLLSRLPAPLVLAGAAYRPAGIGGAIESGIAAARGLLGRCGPG
jgi:oxygen-dependent protoporphyrinogen oxidase